MKRFLLFISLAMIIFAMALTSTFTLTVSADVGNMVDNVVFISDSAVEGGKGTSATDPLYPTILPDSELDPAVYDQTQSDGSVKEDVTLLSRYKNTALYQAIEKLAETGGTVVICGDYTIDDSEARQSNYWSVLEYHLPETKKPVTITSKYNGVDYGATLTLSGYFFTILNGPTVWENLKIHSDLASDRAICCNGNKTVFGEGLTCTKKSSASEAGYISIVGGKRYQTTTKDVDVTVKSGTFYKLVGTTWTNPGNEITCSCDVNLKLEGGTVYYVYGNTHNVAPNSVHAGNVDITITGGKLNGSIVCTGNGGFKSESCSVDIKILGGTFTNSVKVLSRKVYSSLVTGVESKNINIDLSGAQSVKDSYLNSIVTNLPEGAKVTYPAKWITENNSLITKPTESYVFCGDEPSSKGAVISVEYQNPVSTGEKYTQTIEYSKNNLGFSVKCDTSKAGKATAEYYFGNWKYYESDIDVIDVPKVNVEGVQIKIKTPEQQMYAWGNHEKFDTTDVKVKEYGIISVPSDMLLSDEPFDHSNTYGIYDSAADREEYSIGGNTRFAALVFGDEVIRENNYNRDYSIRAYAKIEYNGKEYYRYSEVIERCFYDVAQSAIAGDKETEETKAALKKNVVDVYNNYDVNYCYNPAGAEAARQKVVDYMYKMSDIEWTPEETFIIYNEGGTNTYSLSSGSTRMYGVFYKGQVYHGLPYINKTMAQYESFEDMIDRATIIPLDNPDLTFDRNNGTKDWSNLTAEQKAAGLENAKNFPGNDCLVGLMFGWTSVMNDSETIQGLTSIGSMLKLKNGTLKVGDYDYEVTSEYFTDGLTRTDLLIKEKIGEQKIAEAYAKLQKGDATAYTKQYYKENGSYSNGRHVRIVLDTYVERNADKTINLDKSYVNFIHQAGGATSVYIYNSNDRSLKDTQKTFRQLIDEGALPMTITELATGNVDSPIALASGMELEENLPNGVLDGKIKTNKQLISVRVVFSKGDSVVKEVKELPVSTYANLHLSEYKLTNIDVSDMKLTSGEDYKFDLYVCIAGMDGEELHLVDNYQFTAK